MAGAATPKPQQPGRHVIERDVVYYHHPEDGVCSGRVASVGEHGIHIDHPQGLRKVRWEKVLGHKERRGRRLTLLERGEDGGIAVDEDGTKVFVEGDLPLEDDIEAVDSPEALSKALPGPAAPLLIDIGHLHGPACDHALETLYKAVSEGDGAAFDIWQAHENPFIRAIVEKFSDRGLTKIGQVQLELQKWLAGDYHVPSKASVPIPPGFLGRWTQQELALVKIYLESINPLAMELEDWSLVIDFLVQRYMPLELLLEEGEWLATKAQLMGRVQAHTGTLEAGAASAIAEALPGTVAGAQAMFAYSDAEAAILSFGKESCCDAIVSLTEDMRHRLRRVVLDHQRRKLAGEEVTDQSLESQLFDKFDSLNRDWRRIAVTEAGEMANQGVIAHMDPGTHVRRLEMYHGACAFCRSLDGRVFRVTTPDDAEKDGEHDVWPGKTNMGRSSAPNRRVGNDLVPRAPGERLWPAAGVQHPHCRGRWEPMAEDPPGADKDFTSWLRKQLEAGRE
ncbi:MAG: hypothetical protein ACJ75S_07155 [Solirubrobacterales bacterium]|jgi:hypothetical protein